MCAHFAFHLLCFILISTMLKATQGLEFSTLYHPHMTQDVFLKDDWHYLHSPKLGSYTFMDAFDCTFECLRHSSCLSFNLAASRQADGLLWCELLSSSRYSNSVEYKANASSHHYFIKTQCMSSPCRNGGTCVPNYSHHTFTCKCNDGFTGDLCEKAKSCKALNDFTSLNESKVVALLLDSKPTSVFCHMGDFGCGTGGWTPVMKTDGNKLTFRYDSNMWSNKEIFNLDGGKTGFDSKETKLPSYWDTPFTKICLGMKVNGEQDINFVVINKSAESLFSLISGGQRRNTSLGLATWKALIGGQASLQTACVIEGFNVQGSVDGFSRVRIGIVGEEFNPCGSCDSSIGFGTGGKNPDINTCGNFADDYNPDNGTKSLKAMGYSLVQ
ncbi:uncharacterized protein [Montipora capricornis]|uniref:uncharacterized protein isoform X4 n=2 Tax=Montipora capricornis TaxID=246305 RepID=UPI0035F1E633